MEHKEDNVVYRLFDDGTASVTAVDKFAKSITIKSKVQSHKVTRIDFMACSRAINLIKVSIPSSVCEIGANAFAFCENLVHVYIDAKLITLRKGAFSYCKNLQSIIAYDVKVEENVFKNCYDLWELRCTFVGTLKRRTMESCRNLQRLTCGDNITMEDDIFFDCQELKSIIFEGNAKLDNTLLTELANKNVKIICAKYTSNLMDLAYSGMNVVCY